MNHHPFSQFHAFLSVSTVLFGLENSQNFSVLISNEGKNMGWESFCWKTHFFLLWFWTGKNGFWTDLPKMNLFFLPIFGCWETMHFLVKPIYWIVFLDWALQWITKKNTFSGGCISFEIEISAFEMVIFRFQITQLFGFFMILMVDGC